MPLRAYLLPNWQRRKRMLRIEAWIAIVGAYVLLGLAWLCPNDWSNDSPAFVATWPVNSFFRYLPGVRVDHVYASKHLAFTRLTTGTGEGSDHRPLVAEIAITGEDSQHP
jgi:hypothetical protein